MGQDTVRRLNLLKHINSSDLKIGAKLVGITKDLTVKANPPAHTMNCYRGPGGDVGGVVVEGIWSNGNKRYWHANYYGNLSSISESDAKQWIEYETENGDENVESVPQYITKPWNEVQEIKGFVIPKEKLRVMQLRLRRGHNILLKGEPGTGKTILTELFAEQISYEFHRVNVSGIQRPVDWFGEKNYSPNQGTYFDPSKFIEMIQRPCIIQLDEINRTSPENPNAIFGFLDYNQKVFVDPLGRIIYRHPNCYIFATLNEGAHFTGTYPLDPAFRDRFTSIELDLPSEEDLARLLMVKVTPNSKGTTLTFADATTLAKVVRQLAEMYSSGKVSQYVGFRAAQNAGELRVDGEDLRFSIEESIINMFSKEGEVGSERTKVLQELQAFLPKVMP